MVKNCLRDLQQESGMRFSGVLANGPDQHTCQSGNQVEDELLYFNILMLVCFFNREKTLFSGDIYYS